MGMQVDSDPSSLAIDLFDQVLQLPVDRRRGFLDRHCPDDNTRAEIESLLASHEDAREFFCERATPVPDESYDAGARIGSYELLELIGEGGFARVFRAQQSRPVRREVAFKIIKLGMDTRAVIARFEQERQALAMMDHPGIAAVYDAGATETGRPYFVMELVRGTRITQCCSEKQLPIRQRIELFIDVCRAVQHAHQKGILHRDIKPSNILVTTVDGRAVPKVIDFGIAKATQTRLTEMTMVTQEQQLLGTPQYMSPEQAISGGTDVDTRSDVYSLGAVLYELLTGVAPLEAPSKFSSALTQLQRLTSDEEFPAPSARAAREMQRELRGELDWIIGKCLEKDRTRRYESAAALAADLQRYLENRPINAAPPSLPYRARKFVRRNTIAVVASAIVLTTLLVATIISTTLAIRASRAERLAQKRLHESEAANASFRAVNSFLTRDVIGSADPAVTRGNREMTVREALDNAAKAISDKFPDQPLIEASVRDSVAMAYLKLGHPQQALPHARRALEQRTLVLGELHPDTIVLLNSYAYVLKVLGRLNDAEPLFKQALERSRRILGEDDHHTLASLDNYTIVLTDMGRWSEAEPLSRQGWEQSRHLFGDDHGRTITSLNNYARLLQMMDRAADAEPLFKDVLERRRRLSGQDHPDTLTALNNYALVIKQQARYAEAEPLYKEALERRRQVLGDDHRHTIASMSNYAQLLRTLGRSAEAEPLARDVLQRSRRVQGDAHPDTITLQGNYADLLHSLGRTTEAEPLLKQALELRRRALGEEHPHTLAYLASYAEMLGDMDRHADAEPICQELYHKAAAARISAKTAAQYMSRYGLCLVRLSRYEQSEAPLREAHHRLQDSNQGSSAPMRAVLLALAEVCDRTNRPTEASKWRAELLELERSTQPATQPTTAPS